MVFFNLFILLSLLISILSNSIDQIKKNIINKTFEGIDNLDEMPEKQLIPCIKKIIEYYNNTGNLDNLLSLSSKDYGDLSTYHTCLKDKNNQFYVIYSHLNELQKRQVELFSSDGFSRNILGFCLKKDICQNVSDIRGIFDKIKDKFDIAQSFKFIYKEDYNIIIFIFLNIFIIIQILFLIFKIIPAYIFGILVTLKWNKNKKSKAVLVDAKKEIQKKIKKYFSFSNNIDDLFDIKINNNETFKDADSTYIRGIKSIGIIFFIYGTAFVYLNDYPLYRDVSSEKKKYLKSILFVTIFRIAPSLLLSCSGYTLSYKFLNWLDKQLILEKIVNPTNSKYEKIDNKDEVDSKNTPSKDTISVPSQSQNNIKTTKSNTILTLDEKKDEEEDDDSNYYENSIGIKFYSNDLSSNILNTMFKKQNLEINLSSLSVKLIPCSAFFNFIFRQFHKIIIFIFILIYLIKLCPVLSSINEGSPLLNYLNNEFILQFDYSYDNFIPLKSLFKIFLETDLSNDEENHTILITQFYNIITCEIYFFIIGCLLIFISYKKKLRLDIILCSLIFAFTIIKVVCVLCLKGYNFGTDNNSEGDQNKTDEDRRDEECEEEVNEEYGKNEEEYEDEEYEGGEEEGNNDNPNKIDDALSPDNPGMFYFDSNFRKLFFHPIYNFDYYAIGMLFGMFNYVIQNEYDTKYSIIKERPMIRIPCVCLKFLDYKIKRNFFIFLAVIILMIIFLVIYPIIFSFDFENIIIYSSQCPVPFRIFGTFDVDFFTFLFHLFVLFCYFTNRNMVFKFLNSKIWILLPRIYFAIISTAPIFIYYIIFNNATQINLHISVSMVYGSISAVFLIFLSILLSLTFEQPYKKLIKFFFNVDLIMSQLEEEENEKLCRESLAVEQPSNEVVQVDNYSGL